MIDRIRRQTSRRAIVGALATSLGVIAVLVGTQPASAIATATGIRASVRGTDGSGYWIGGNDGPTPTGVVSPYTPLGGQVTGVVDVVVVPPGGGRPPTDIGTPYYIATGTDQNLWVRSETHTWGPLFASPVHCTSSPAATSVVAGAAGARVLVVGCRGLDGALWYGAEAPAPSDPSQLPQLPNASWTSLGGQIVNAPAIAAVLPFGSANNELTFFANGTDGHVYTHTLAVAAGWTWTAWRCLNHLAAGAVISGAGDVTLFACEGEDHAAYAFANRGAGWGAPILLGGTLLDGPGVAVGTNAWTVFAEGADHALWQTSGLIASDTADGWTSAGGRLTDGATGAALLAGSDNP